MKKSIAAVILMVALGLCAVLCANAEECWYDQANGIGYEKVDMADVLFKHDEYPPSLVWYGTDWILADGSLYHLRDGIILTGLSADNIYAVQGKSFAVIGDMVYDLDDRRQYGPMGTISCMVGGHYLLDDAGRTFDLLTGKISDPVSPEYADQFTVVDLGSVLEYDYVVDRSSGICYHWKTGKLVHPEIRFVCSANHNVSIIDGYAFGERTLKDGKTEAVVIRLKDRAVIHAFSGAWSRGSTDTGSPAIYYDGTACVLNEDKEIFSIINWKTGKVLKKLKTEDVMYAPEQYDCGVWCWSEGEEESRYFSGGKVWKAYPMNAVQKKILKRDGIKARRSYDGYYSGAVLQEGEEECWGQHYVVYDAKGKAFFHTYYTQLGNFADWQGMNANEQMFGYSACLLVSTAYVDEQHAKVGVYSRDHGLVLPVEFDHVVICDGGLAAWKDGVCHLYDQKGKQVW